MTATHRLTRSAAGQVHPHHQVVRLRSSLIGFPGSLLRPGTGVLFPVPCPVPVCSLFPAPCSLPSLLYPPRSSHSIPQFKELAMANSPRSVQADFKLRSQVRRVSARLAGAQAQPPTPNPGRPSLCSLTTGPPASPAAEQSPSSSSAEAGPVRLDAYFPVHQPAVSLRQPMSPSTAPRTAPTSRRLLQRCRHRGRPRQSRSPPPPTSSPTGQPATIRVYWSQTSPRVARRAGSVPVCTISGALRSHLGHPGADEMESAAADAPARAWSSSLPPATTTPPTAGSTPANVDVPSSAPTSSAAAALKTIAEETV